MFKRFFYLMIALLIGPLAQAYAMDGCMSQEDAKNVLRAVRSEVKDWELCKSFFNFHIHPSAFDYYDKDHYFPSPYPIPEPPIEEEDPDPLKLIKPIEPDESMGFKTVHTENPFPDWYWTDEASNDFKSVSQASLNFKKVPHTSYSQNLADWCAGTDAANVCSSHYEGDPGDPVDEHDEYLNMPRPEPQQVLTNEQEEKQIDVYLDMMIPDVQQVSVNFKRVPHTYETGALTAEEEAALLREWAEGYPGPLQFENALTPEEEEALFQSWADEYYGPAPSQFENALNQEEEDELFQSWAEEYPAPFENVLTDEQLYQKFMLGGYEQAYKQNVQTCPHTSYADEQYWRNYSAAIAGEAPVCNQVGYHDDDYIPGCIVDLPSFPTTVSDVDDSWLDSVYLGGQTDAERSGKYMQANGNDGGSWNGMNTNGCLIDAAWEFESHHDGDPTHGSATDYRPVSTPIYPMSWKDMMWEVACCTNHVSAPMSSADMMEGAITEEGWEVMWNSSSSKDPKYGTTLVFCEPPAPTPPPPPIGINPGCGQDFGLVPTGLTVPSNDVEIIYFDHDVPWGI